MSLDSRVTKHRFLRKRACFLVDSQGKDMYLILENDTLSLVDPMDRTVLHSQPIASIRVWGVGRDNGRVSLCALWDGWKWQRRTSPLAKVALQSTTVSGSFLTAKMTSGTQSASGER